MKYKDRCCKSFKKKGKGCKKCPLLNTACEDKLQGILEKLKGRKAKAKFEKRYLAA